MASGITHDNISLTGGLLALAVSIYAGLSIDLALVLGSSLVIGGMYLSPDLDIQKSLPSRRWGLLGSIIWRPLRHRGHRSRLSHGWIVGSLFRLCLLFLWTSPFIVAAVWFLGMPPAWLWGYVGWSVLGVLAAGEAHLITDYITTGDNDRYS